MAAEQPKSDLKPELHPVLIGKLGLSPHDDQAVALWPELMGMLLPKYDSKRRLTREPGIMTLKVDGPVFRVSLICPSEEGQTVMAFNSLVDLFDQIELAVVDPKTVWTQTYDSKKRTGQALKTLLGY